MHNAWAHTISPAHVNHLTNICMLCITPLLHVQQQHIAPFPAVAAAAVSPVSAVTIRGGKIVDVADKLPAQPRYPVIDYKYAVISPGVIDVHVHMNEPGREHWEGVCAHKL
jgi:imidazolonepropionase-like amidohydrolase